MTTTGTLRWRPTTLALSLATCSAVAVTVAVVAGRVELLAFAAPLLGALAGGRRPARHARSLLVHSTLSDTRCFEGDDVRVSVEVGPEDGTVEEFSLALRGSSLETSTQDGHGWIVRPRRWGHWSLRAHVTARTNAGLLEADMSADAGELRVYPRPRTLAAAPRTADLPDRAGVHTGRRRGGGIEFAAVRPYQAGDTLRRINWPATARRGRLQVTDRVAEQAAEVIAVIDTFSDVPQAGGSSLDLAVHGATDLVRAALRRGDRTGVVALGGIVRRLGPDIGERQFYRVVETVLECRLDDVVVEPDLTRIPRSALPPRAAVVVFSPLLAERTVGVLRDLRERGCPVVVVDVLRTEPPVEHRSRQIDRVAVRMWRIERRGVVLALARLGIPVVPWKAGEWLDEVLGPLTRRPLPGRTA
ncbi:DUF58 domain-containing protein [Actinophytocola sp.]|uniref:DUF58 domain-containing protein n=1 Tax=Actinophytocola sp. TaxID=1872138 RepID=UPI0025BF8106|nr:DUF58 domain-containing protein [Actinophytocola sp.]